MPEPDMSCGGVRGGRDGCLREGRYVVGMGNFMSLGWSCQAERVVEEEDEDEEEEEEE